MPGLLVLIGTPIGNLGDLSSRAIEQLGRADAIACEDTRRTGRLLAHLGITGAKLITVNDHTETARVEAILGRLATGERVAVVSDAGMPGISDPGEVLVRAATDAGHEIDVIPGPSAAITALVASALPAGRFHFEGFLPRKGSGRGERLRRVATSDVTVVLYEAPHRVGRTLADLADLCGPDRRIAIGRELTKLHQEFWRGSLVDAVGWADEGTVRGELVLVLDAAPPVAPLDDEGIRAALVERVEAGRSTRDAVAEVVAVHGVPKRVAYAIANDL